MLKNYFFYILFCVRILLENWIEDIWWVTKERKKDLHMFSYKVYKTLKEVYKGG